MLHQNCSFLFANAFQHWGIVSYHFASFAHPSPKAHTIRVHWTCANGAIFPRGHRGEGGKMWSCNRRQPNGTLPVGLLVSFAELVSMRVKSRMRVVPVLFPPFQCKREKEKFTKYALTTDVSRPKGESSWVREPTGGWLSIRFWCDDKHTYTYTIYKHIHVRTHIKYGYVGAGFHDLIILLHSLSANTANTDWCAIEQLKANRIGTIFIAWMYESSNKWNAYTQSRFALLSC